MFKRSCFNCFIRTSLITLSFLFVLSSHISINANINHAVLAPGTYFEDPDDLLKDLISKKPKKGPFEAIDKWLDLHIKVRETRAVYWGRIKDPDKLRDREISSEVHQGLRDVEDALSRKEWTKGYEDLIEIIKLMHQYPLDYSGYELEKVRNCYLWSYCMLPGHQKIPKEFWRFAQAIQNFANPPPESGFNLAIADINVLLWMEEYGINDLKIVLDSSVLTDRQKEELGKKWYKKIDDWGELVGAPDDRPRRLRDEIMDWLIITDDPTSIYRWNKTADGGTAETVLTRNGSFRSNPLDYIISMYYDVIDAPPARQAFEDGNHRTGSIIINYLLLIHLNALAIDVFTGDYQKGRGHLTVENVIFIGDARLRMREIYGSRDLALAA